MPQGTLTGSTKGLTFCVSDYFLSYKTEVMFIKVLLSKVKSSETIEEIPATIWAPLFPHSEQKFFLDFLWLLQQLWRELYFIGVIFIYFFPTF